MFALDIHFFQKGLQRGMSLENIFSFKNLSAGERGTVVRELLNTTEIMVRDCLHDWEELACSERQAFCRDYVADR